MRESRKTERMRLPPDSIEVWLATQTAKPVEVEHRNPPKDTYEAWIERLVEGRESETKPTAK